MKADFTRMAREAIANPFLQRALDRNAERRTAARLEAFAALPSPEGLRDRARAIRERTLANLDQYLETFIANAQANGFIVHRAIDAEHSNRIAVQIAQTAGAEKVAKSKSMVSEEIRLNRALEAAGIEAVETDLGEFIVQLRGEAPAHIITPAVHLRKEEVASTFEQKLGMAVTSDVEALNAMARRVLREVFFTAPVGISGVNFGVAESGTLCLVTNEGNGRMVTTLPPTHIALMGVERLVPTLEDLAVMLRLLPRAATGQKLTSYVSLIQGPRRGGEPDGPKERHLILIDNGRLQMAASQLSESLLCIRCGACLNACPVFREVGGHTYGSVYSGPIGSVVSPGLFGAAEFGHLAKASTLCGACLEACPVRIDLPTLLLRVRKDYVEAGQSTPSTSLGIRLYTWFAESPRRFRWGQRAASWATRLSPRKGGWLHVLPPPLSGWNRFRHFPPFAREPFRDRWPAIATESGAQEPPASSTEQASASKGRAASGRKPSPGPVPSAHMARFQQELELVGGEFVRCPTREAPERVLRELQKLQCTEMLSWGDEDPLLKPALELLRERGVQLHETRLADAMGDERAKTLARLGRVRVGLTGATAGLAETGTLVLPGGRARPLLASLLPSVHLALVRADAIHASLEAWLEAGGEAAIQEASSAVLITGPSRTADIEMTLTIGVHGPGRLIVFCLD